jgi:hypothetical protein
MYAIYAMLRLVRTSSTSVFDCPVYDKIRLKCSSLFNPESYEGLGFNFSFAELLPAAKIQFLIGDIGYLLSSDVGYFYDSIGKMFLKECFDLRHELMILMFLISYPFLNFEIFYA